MQPTDLKQCEEKFWWHPGLEAVVLADNHNWQEVFSDEKRQFFRCQVCGKESIGEPKGDGK